MNRILALTVTLVTIGAAAMMIDLQSRGVKPAPAATGITAVISAPGIVEGATEEVVLRPEVIGTVTKHLVEIGDYVQAGQPLMQLDDRTARLDVAAARAQLASARAERDRLVNGAHQQERDEARALSVAAEARLNNAERVRDRNNVLQRRNAISEKEAEEARYKVAGLQAELSAARARVALLESPAREDEVRLADARIAAAEARLSIAEITLDKTVLRAPTHSQILEINAEVGELLTPSTTSPVLVLADTRVVRIRAFIEELDAPRVQVGASVEIMADGLPGKRFTGTVATLSPRMSFKEVFTGQPNELYDTKVREVLIDADGGEGLIVGLRVDVRISNVD